MSSLSGVVDPRTAKALASLQITTVAGLLRHYPRRYVEHGQLTDLAALRVGEEVTVLARIESVRSRNLPNAAGNRRPRSVQEVIVTDGRDQLALAFFNQAKRARFGDLREGNVGLFSGTVGLFRGQRQLLSPDLKILADSPDALTSVEDFVGRPLPVYPANAKISSMRIADALVMVLPLAAEVIEPLDDVLRARAGVLDLPTALRWIHRPADLDQVRQARRRLRWDEAFGLQVVLAQRRAAAVGAPAIAREGRAGGILAAFDARLPFVLTAAQRDVGDLLAAELGGAHPMHRLLQGEVGSGKTVVALRAMLQVVDSGGQAALLAPTEVLAAQHARTIDALLGPLARAGQLGGEDQGTGVALLTGSQGASARRAALTHVAAGTAGIVIGTHALLEQRVQFVDLGMVVIDEQHRFGVEQRAALVAKAGADRRPHTLVMTATPIPRTIAMTVFGDLEVSTLRELPPGRSQVATHVVPALERPAYLVRAWQRVREEVAAGGQVYVVCPRIDAAEAEADAEPALADEALPSAPPAAVATVTPELAAGPLAGLRLAALTGRMTAAEKDDVMARFVDPSGPEGIDVLVATTVIEVGIDVSRATMMVVLDAERFGVSQLHQLRGRVGRGSAPGVCLLVTTAPEGTPARERLAAVAATSDGFELSRFDLAARREGDVLGQAQSGSRRSLRFLSVLDHEDVIAAARAEAASLIADDPDLSDHPALAQALAEEFDDDETSYLEKA